MKDSPEPGQTILSLIDYIETLDLTQAQREKVVYAIFPVRFVDEPKPQAVYPPKGSP